MVQIVTYSLSIYCEGTYIIMSMKRKGKYTVSEIFGLSVRERRHALGISQEELAARSGLHRTYIGDIERGNRNVSVVNIVKLARGLGITPSELLAPFNETDCDEVECDE